MAAFFASVELLGRPVGPLGHERWLAGSAGSARHGERAIRPRRDSAETPCERPAWSTHPAELTGRISTRLSVRTSKDSSSEHTTATRPNGRHLCGGTPFTGPLTHGRRSWARCRFSVTDARRSDPDRELRPASVLHSQVGGAVEVKDAATGPLGRR